MRLPSLNALRAFEAAARHRSFARAAEELCVTEGAISRHVKLLETALQVELFRRLPRGLVLTDAGRNFQPILEAAFESIAEGARDLQRQPRHLKVICPPTFSIRWLLPRLDRFKQQWPAIDVRLTTAPFDWEIFFGGEFDLAFDCGYPNRPKDIEAVLVLQSLCTPVCSPRLLERGVPLTSPADLVHHNLLHETPDRHDWRVWAGRFAPNLLDLNSGEVLPTADMAYRAAAMGQGIAIGDLSVLHEEIASGALVQPFKDMQVCDNTEAYHLCARRDCWADPRIATFHKWVLDEANKGEPI
ncbi:LysR substrate-binding domain-containing protein [Mesorhizobium sp.]|nr:LysR substrate-binding domain-containing protein [Mesorhizobium sp.]